MPICQHCGTGLPVGHKFCYECGRSVDSQAAPVFDGERESPASEPQEPAGPLSTHPPANLTGGWQTGPAAPYAPPGPPPGWRPAPPARDSFPGSPRSEGVLLRAVAALIDFVLAMVVFVTGLVVWMLATSDPNLGERLNGGKGGNLRILVGLLMVLTWYVYAVVLEATWGTTLGKRVVGLTVIMDDGRRCTWAGSLVRNIFKFFTFTAGWPLVITLVSILADSRHRRLGDMAARTFVVKRGSQPEAEDRRAGTPPGYGPPPGYGSPPGFGPPPGWVPPGYGPPPGWGPPPPGYGPPPPGWGPPPPGYGPPPGWGGAPPQGHRSPPTPPPDSTAPPVPEPDSAPPPSDAPQPPPSARSAPPDGDAS